MASLGQNELTQEKLFFTPIDCAPAAKDGSYVVRVTFINIVACSYKTQTLPQCICVEPYYFIFQQLQPFLRHKQLLSYNTR